MKGGITTDPTDIKRIKMEYCEQLILYVTICSICDYKFDNPDELDKCLKKQNLPKVTRDRIQNLNSPLSKEFKFLSKNFPQRNVQTQRV